MYSHYFYSLNLIYFSEKFQDKKTVITNINLEETSYFYSFKILEIYIFY